MASEDIKRLVYSCLTCTLLVLVSLVRRFPGGFRLGTKLITRITMNYLMHGVLVGCVLLSCYWWSGSWEGALSQLVCGLVGCTILLLPPSWSVNTTTDDDGFGEREIRPKTTFSFYHGPSGKELRCYGVDEIRTYDKPGRLGLRWRISKPRKPFRLICAMSQE